jgi:hypothetical protein
VVAFSTTGIAPQSWSIIILPTSCKLVSGVQHVGSVVMIPLTCISPYLHSIRTQWSVSPSSEVGPAGICSVRSMPLLEIRNVPFPAITYSTHSDAIPFLKFQQQLRASIQLSCVSFSFARLYFYDTYPTQDIEYQSLGVAKEN